MRQQLTVIGTLTFIGLVIAYFSLYTCGVYIVCMGTIPILDAIMLYSKAKDRDFLTYYFTEIYMLLIAGLFIWYCGVKLMISNWSV